MIEYWKAASPHAINLQYFCHGLTFNGGGPLSFSPVGDSVPAILGKFYTPIAGKDSLAGDIVVGKDATGVQHSCVIITPKFNADGSLDLVNTIVNTKNGLNAEVQTTLGAVMDTYTGCTWTFYTRK
jgi:hypothetical protein